MNLPIRYCDRRELEKSVLTNDGKVLRTVLRGVSFAGADFDQLEPTPGQHDATQIASFTLANNTLCACVIDGTLPVMLVSEQREVPGCLEYRLELGDPAPNGGIDRETLCLSIKIGQRRYASAGRSGYFDDELADLVLSLPDGVRMKCCWTCAYSDYFPSGNGLFGGLACFRDNKVGYARVKGKAQLFQIQDTMTEFVQETHLCAEHDWRPPGTGYRG